VFGHDPQFVGPAFPVISQRAQPRRAEALIQIPDPEPRNARSSSASYPALVRAGGRGPTPRVHRPTRLEAHSRRPFDPALETRGQGLTRAGHPGRGLKFPVM